MIGTQHLRTALLLTLALLTALPAFAMRPDPAETRDIAVYLRGIAEIREVREVELQKGENEILLPYIPSSAVGGSFRLSILDGKVETHSIALALDLLDEDLIWQARIGETVTLETYDTTYTGTLLRVSSSMFYFRPTSNPDIIQSVPYGDVRPPELTEPPGDLVTETSLRWTYDSKKKHTATIELSYRIENITWYADYRLTTQRDQGRLHGMTVIENFTNLPLPYDRLTLVAGEVHLAGDSRRVDRLNPQPGAAMANAGTEGGIRRWNFDEPGMLRSGHITTLPLIDETRLAVNTTYVYDAAIFNDRIATQLEVAGASSTKPLPAGTVHIYRQHDDDILFIGEDTIDNTPPGAPLELRVNQAFDLTAQRKRMRETANTRGGSSQTYTVTLGNSMAETVTVDVLERLFGDWSLEDVACTTGTVTPETMDARTAKFTVTVPAGETTELTYTVVYSR